MGTLPRPLPQTPVTPSSPTKAMHTSLSRGTKSWDEIIPVEELAKIKESEEQQEQLQLYLPPRQKTRKVRLFESVCY